jgi:sulfopyruvate decarboxylase subunit beta
MMTQREALEILAAQRNDRVVITTMGAVGIWPSISDTPLDFAYLPSSMGQGIAIGLGFALATKRGTVVISGDGSLLMNLGCLVTVANHPAPLTILLIDNGLYEVTGGQDIVGATKTDYVGLATAVGIKNAYRFTHADDWRQHIASILQGPQPSFVQLCVQGTRGQKTPAPPRPMSEQITRLQSAVLGG